MERKPIIAGITQGDINGIGYEVIMKTLDDPLINDICVPIVYGSPKVAAYHRKVLNIANFTFNTIRTAEEANPKKANMINCLGDEVRVELGKSTPEGGEASLAALECAVGDLIKGTIEVLVTAPVDKHNMQSDKFRFRGHTDYLKDKLKVSDVLMLMVCDSMKIGFVTDHIPLKDVAQTVTTQLILRKLKIMNQSLLQDFGIRRPRIAVLGLNPHAGDAGLIGNEEKMRLFFRLSQKPMMRVYMPLGHIRLTASSVPDSSGNSMPSLQCTMIRDWRRSKRLHSTPGSILQPGCRWSALLPSTEPHLTLQVRMKLRKTHSGRQYMWHATFSGTGRCMPNCRRNPLQHQKIDIHADRVDELPPEIENNDHAL